MSTQEIATFLRENPKYREILQRAIDVEEKNTSNPHWLGWEWHEVRAYPAHLVKLVIEGIIKVNFKSNSSTNYLLVDRDSVKEVVGVGAS